ncbi:EthD family reductase [Flavobacterium nackdongense]|uniref:EthD family reductase n=1 Tax=Flavobacterium nackdongense TaxID=2547394 RepID=A0A4P6YCA5_9FLAO|nr:EthD family reductase [Flavobacterium nackdongense]QBN17980.1 EthD family reductase [Flavobacterium nackdongense]
MIKLTVLYGQPTDSEAFESYYANIHLPLASKMTGHEKVEFTKFLDGADGEKPLYYRMAEFWYSNIEIMQRAMGSPEGQTTTADLSNFATGGVTLLVGEVV